MRGPDPRGAPPGVELTDDPFHEGHPRRVQVGRGLVQQQHLGVQDQGARQGDELGFAAGQVPGRSAGQGAQAQRVQHGLDPLPEPARAPQA